MKHKKIYLCLFVFLLIFALTACQSGEQTFYNVNTMHTATSLPTMVKPMSMSAISDIRIQPVL